jgi:NADH-quinone oxidoreductase subunit A
LYDQFAFVIAFTLFGIAFVVVSVAVLSRILRPRVPNAVKEMVYECGEPTIGSSWVRFDIRLYTVAIVFLLFEVEVASLFPWARVFKGLSGEGLAEEVAKIAAETQVMGLPFVFVEAAIFLIILGVGLAYVWAKGDLDWVKATAHGFVKGGKEES